MFLPHWWSEGWLQLLSGLTFSFRLKEKPSRRSNPDYPQSLPSVFVTVPIFHEVCVLLHTLVPYARSGTCVLTHLSPLDGKGHESPELSELFILYPPEPHPCLAHEVFTECIVLSWWTKMWWKVTKRIAALRWKVNLLVAGGTGDQSCPRGLRTETLGIVLW